MLSTWPVFDLSFCFTGVRQAYQPAYYTGLSYFIVMQIKIKSMLQREFWIKLKYLGISQGVTTFRFFPHNGKTFKYIQTFLLLLLCLFYIWKSLCAHVEVINGFIITPVTFKSTYCPTLCQNTSYYLTSIMWLLQSRTLESQLWDTQAALTQALTERERLLQEVRKYDPTFTL